MSFSVGQIGELPDLSSAPGLVIPAWQGANDVSRLVLRSGASVGETGEVESCCYLVEHGLVADYVDVDDSRPTCVGLIGPGEIVGLGKLFGKPAGRGAQSSAVGTVQLLRLATAELQTTLLNSRDLLDVCLRQMQAQLIEIQHVAACNARHLLPARCAHWLLRLQSRLGDTLPVTHEFLASVLGVRRAGITVTLQSLQRDGVIRQQRGSIVILDSERLRAAGCSCPLAIERPVWPRSMMGIQAPVPPSPMPERPGPRIWFESALRARGDEGLASGNDPVARIDTALQICRDIMEQTQAILVA